jgi:hypothetical protein
MAEEKESTERQRSKPARRIAVTNMHRYQPLLFHVIGGGVRLAPLETRELDRDCLASPELSGLVRVGAVRVVELGRPETGEQAESAPPHAAARSPRVRRQRGSEPSDDDK